MTRATLRNVAAKAGVSYQTVSNVVNGNPKMSAATRELVISVMRELGYEPNHSARSLKTARTATVAYVVYPTTAAFDDPWSGKVLAGFHHALRTAGYDLLTHTVADEDRWHLEALRSAFLQRRIDGAILTGEMPDGVVEELAAWPHPLVAFDRRVRGGSIAAVWADHANGTALAVRHLHQRGRRRIGFVAGPSLSPDCAAAARLDGYLSGLESVSLPPDPALVATGNWEYDSGRAALVRLLDLADPPDAVVAANDRMAVGVIQEARARGLAVPGDLSVVGFDDFEFARHIDPPLTTVHLPVAEMAARAVDLLLARIEGRPQLGPEQPVLPVELLIRGST